MITAVIYMGVVGMLPLLFIGFCRAEELGEEVITAYRRWRTEHES